MSDRPTLDAALAAWATTEPAGAGDAAALARIVEHAETNATRTAAPARPDAGSRFRPKPGWMLGGALAASFAIALLLAPQPGTSPGTTPGAASGDGGVVVASARNVEGGSVMPAEADGSESAAFALLYTPTVEEEYQL
jgi:hypothetical protein